MHRGNLFGSRQVWEKCRVSKEFNRSSYFFFFFARRSIASHVSRQSICHALLTSRDRFKEIALQAEPIEGLCICRANYIFLIIASRARFLSTYREKTR